MNSPNTRLFHDGVRFLAENGLNLFSSLAIAALPDAIQTQLKESDFSLDDYSHLMMTGNGGNLFWGKLQEKNKSPTDPVDNFSMQLTHQFIKHYLDKPAYLLLYPLTQYVAPLTQLGEFAGWSHPAPIGQGINEEFGVWFAYRTAFLVNGRFPTTPLQHTKSPCASCSHKRCISACPPAAIKSGAFDIFICADFRITQNSVCADRCLARMACPVAPEHRYSLPQIQYHYSQSLATIRAYKK